MQQDNLLSSDHDLLIELRTEMRGLRSEVRELRDNNSARISAHSSKIADLQDSKMDKEEFYRVKDISNKSHDQIWTRLNWVTGIAFIAIGIILSLEFYFNFLR